MTTNQTTEKASTRARHHNLTAVPTAEALRRYERGRMLLLLELDENFFKRVRTDVSYAVGCRHCRPLI